MYYCRRVRCPLDRSLCAVYQSISRLVGRLVVISQNQSVKQSVRKERNECILVGRDDKEGSRRLDIYRKMPRH